MFDTFSFQTPWVFLLFLPFILSYFFFEKERATYYMPHFYTKLQGSFSQSKIVPFLRWLILFFVIVALSDPLQTQTVQTEKHNALDIVLSLDTSGSMSLYGFDEKEYEKTRLAVVKEVVRDFIDTRKNDRIGLVLFGTHSAIISPLSFDKKAQKNIVKQIQVGVLGKSTALIDSLLSSIQLLKKSSSKSKIIILLSDGEDSSSIVPLALVLKLAKEQNITIYTIQIDKSQNNMMQIIAKENKAKSFSATSKLDLQKVYKTIDGLEKSKIAYKTIKVQKHLFTYPLFLAVCSAFLLLFFAKGREI